MVAPVSGKLSKRDQAAVDATPQDIANLATVSEDPYAGTVTISTEPFYQMKQGILGLVLGDRFVRIFYNKKTGAIRYQIYIWVKYLEDWQFFDRFAYIGIDGPTTGDLVKIDRSVNCSRSMCMHTEQVGMPVDEKTMRRVASQAKAGVDASWMFKIYGKFEGGSEVGLLKTEIAGALIALDRYLAQNGATLERGPLGTTH